MTGLTWLVFCSRAIRVEEFAEAISLDQHGVPDPERWKRCGLLLKSLEPLASVISRRITSADFDYTAAGFGKKIHDIKIAHFSVQEYLTSERIGKGPAHSFRIERGKAHALIAEMCLKYLLRFKTESSVSPNAVAEQRLFRYAASSWHVHLREAAQDRQQDLAKLAVTFLRSPALQGWLRVYHPISRSLSPPWDLYSVDKPSVPLFYASSFGLVETVRTLLVEDREQINSSLGEMRSCVPIAARHGFNGVAQLLIDNGADLRNKDWKGDTALHEAAQNGQASTARLLLSSGATASSKGREGQTALHDAADKGFTEICGILIAHGAVLDHRDKSGKTALHCACGSRHAAVVSCLLDHGADVLVEDNEGNTPLHEACSTREPLDGNIIDLLIERGAKCDLRSCLGWTPFMLAVDHENFEAAKRLLQYGRQTLFPEDRSVRYAVDGENCCWPDSLPGVIEDMALRRTGMPSPNPPDALEEDPMDRVVQLLLESNYGRPEDYGTVLLRSAEWGWINTCKHLLEVANTNPLHQNDDGETALHIAIRTYSDYSGQLYDFDTTPFQKRLEHVCEVLLKVGGGRIAQIPDKEGNVPFKMAFKLQ